MCTVSGVWRGDHRRPEGVFGVFNDDHTVLRDSLVNGNTSGTGTSGTSAGCVWTNTQFRVLRDSAIVDNHPTNCTGSPIAVSFCTN
ncbi:hypothetical protein [Kitasatospora sp. GP82]|uniref:hypothetical protein n=1 Tax=Kitasatospora sp. GP82 TaxID=3035089 RepID=UPI002475153F|nr:hypothetical protein [Kitasatospora sp. GP82]